MRLAQNGVDLLTIQRLLGHTSSTTTERYAHHYVESLRRGIAVLDAAAPETIITILSQFGGKAARGEGPDGR